MLSYSTLLTYIGKEEYNLFKNEINIFNDLVKSLDLNLHEIDQEIMKIRDGMNLNNSEKALEFILNNAKNKFNLGFVDFIKIMLWKELSQIKYQINDVQDSIVDFIGWILLYEKYK
jgi:hypothetical protein